MAQFAKLPTWWIRTGLLKTEFKSGRSTGQSIAGLKCLMAISLRIDFYTLEAKVSFTDLEKLTGLSRPMVVVGLKLLEAVGIVQITKGYPNTYKLLESEQDSGWAKLPTKALRTELSGIPNRGRVIMFAIKFYLQLLADRPNSSDVMHMTYDTIRDKVGTQQRDIKPSIDTLFNHSLISVNKSETDFVAGRTSYKKNEYVIRGLKDS